MSTVTTVPIVNIHLFKLFSKISKYADDLRNVGRDVKAQAASDLWAIANNSGDETFKNYLISTTTTAADTSMQDLQVDGTVLSSFLNALKSYAGSFTGITTFDGFLTDQFMMVPENFADIYYASLGTRLSRANVMPSMWKKATSTTYTNALSTITWTDGTASESSTTSATLSSNISACYPMCAVITTQDDLTTSVTATATLVLNSAGDETLTGKTIFDLDDTALETRAAGDYTWPCGAVAMDESAVASGTITFDDATTFGTANTTHYTNYYATAVDNYIRYVYIMGLVTVSGSDYVVGQRLAITAATPGSKTLSYTSADLLYNFKTSTNVVILPMYYGFTTLAASDTAGVDGVADVRPFDVYPETYEITFPDGDSTTTDEADYDGIVDSWVAAVGSFPTTTAAS